LAGILKHKAIDYHRKRKIDFCEISNETYGGWLYSPEKCHLSIEFVHELCSYLEELPPKEAEVFICRVFRDFDTAEICEYLEINNNYCGQLFYRARNKLKETINDRWL
jgi:RNA polymerase sigma factor (sigma-70 family)